VLHKFVEYRRIDKELKAQRATLLFRYAGQLRAGELVGLPGIWQNNAGTPSPDTNTHADVDLRRFASERRTITGNNWLIIGDLEWNQEDKDALHDLKVRREAHARILVSRAHQAAPEVQAVQRSAVPTETAGLSEATPQALDTRSPRMAGNVSRRQFDEDWLPRLLAANPKFSAGQVRAAFWDGILAVRIRLLVPDLENAFPDWLAAEGLEPWLGTVAVTARMLHAVNPNSWQLGLEGLEYPCVVHKSEVQLWAATLGVAAEPIVSATVANIWTVIAREGSSITLGPVTQPSNVGPAASGPPTEQARTPSPAEGAPDVPPDLEPPIPPEWDAPLQNLVVALTHAKALILRDEFLDAGKDALPRYNYDAARRVYAGRLRQAGVTVVGRPSKQDEPRVELGRLILTDWQAGKLGQK
jgi:hypothetical protein